MAVTVVYIDRVAVLNLMVDYLLLMTTATLAGTPLRRLRFGLCAVGGSAYAVAVFLLPVLAHPLCRIGAGIVMALCAFGEEVRPWRLTALFWLLSGGLAGLLLALGLLSGAPYGLVSRVSYADISWPVLLGGAAVFYGLLHLLFRQTARHERGELMDIDVVVGGRRCRLRALRDNGNTLRDPIRGQPVLVAEAAALRASVARRRRRRYCGRAVPPEEKMALLHRAGVDIALCAAAVPGGGNRGRTAAGLSQRLRPALAAGSVMHTLVALTDTQVGRRRLSGPMGRQGEREDSHDTVAAACTMDPTAGQAG